ncbi:hypothetical protein BM524_06910 [Alteromonas mediterranea]|uniref:Uncharacterized protein n=1 Tax=Alteromonas mediterranea TaxID=314275 RepID=A0AAC9J9F3_9ALTE|nr:hypothetical protein [Alteromonas mediterranea]APD89544.1 hypothetical protein BM524_06910 [Alteromonas mediterranea]
MKRVFWVNVNSSYKEVVDGCFLWAPKLGVRKDGITFKRPGWEQLKKVSPGDIVFMHRKQHIVGVATAASVMYDSEIPRTRKPTNPDYLGNKIDITIRLLQTPVSTEEFKEDFILNYNKQCTPLLFNKENNVTQSYLYEMPIAAAFYLSDALGPQFPASILSALKNDD